MFTSFTTYEIVSQRCILSCSEEVILSEGDQSADLLSASAEEVRLGALNGDHLRTRHLKHALDTCLQELDAGVHEEAAMDIPRAAEEDASEAEDEQPGTGAFRTISWSHS